MQVLNIEEIEEVSGGAITPIFPSPVTSIAPLVIWGAHSVYTGLSNQFTNVMVQASNWYSSVSGYPQ